VTSQNAAQMDLTRAVSTAKVSVYLQQVFAKIITLS